MYKFTGNFAPINQLLGLFKYGRGKIKPLSQTPDPETLQEQKIKEGITDVVAIYPGRFQPMGRHHAQVYKALLDEYGPHHTFIATSNAVDGDKSPFDFQEKQMIAGAYGIPPEQVVMTKNPYKATEILDNFNPDTTAVIYFVGAKDMRENPRFGSLGGLTQKGTPRYFRPLERGEELEGWGKHGYIAVAPHVALDMMTRASLEMAQGNFPGEAPPENVEMSGTALRDALAIADEDSFEQIMGFYNADLYKLIKNKLNGAPVDEKLPVEAMEESQLPLGIFRSLAEEVFTEISAAAKKRVSKKIPILKDEGYPTDQAVAIAHSMEEEGKLIDEDEELEEMAGGTSAMSIGLSLIHI